MPLTETGRIFFISGAPGVGKSTTAFALANRFEKSIHFNLDYFRALVVKGLKQPTQGWDEETRLQFQIAHQAVGASARIYADAGFTVVAEHCSALEMVQEFLDFAGESTVVCLKASLETNLKRNLMRLNKSFDPKDIEHFVLSMGDSLYLEFSKEGITVLDNTNLDVEHALDEILSLKPMLSSRKLS